MIFTDSVETPLASAHNELMRTAKGIIAKAARADSDGSADIIRLEDRIEGHQPPTARNQNGHQRRIELHSATSIPLDPSAPYRIKGLVHDGDFSVVYGQSGCGKTFLVLHLVYMIATGRDVFGRRVRPGRVALFALEGSSGLSKRLAAIQAAHGAAENLYIHRDPLILFKNKEAVKDVIAAILEYSADVVVFDTLSRTMSGANENSPEDMTHMVGVFGQIQAATGAHVMLVHHSGKNEALGARGHSSLRAAVDVELEVSSGEGGERTLRVTKGRDDADGLTYGFKLKVVDLGEDDDGDCITTCVVEELGTQALKVKAPKLNKGDAQALSWLREAVNEYGQEPPFDLPAGIQVVTKDRWTEIARKRTGEGSDDTIRKAISRAITNLSVAKMIAVHDPYFWVTK
jgi:energy-coupling factor transporter ATP-binding protein EcfA2